MANNCENEKMKMTEVKNGSTNPVPAGKQVRQSTFRLIFCNVTDLGSSIRN